MFGEETRLLTPLKAEQCFSTYGIDVVGLMQGFPLLLSIRILEGFGALGLETLIHRVRARLGCLNY